MTTQLTVARLPGDRTELFAQKDLSRELRQAIEQGNLVAVQDALGRGANPNSYSVACGLTGWPGERVIHQAVRKDYPGIVELLIKSNASVTTPSETLQTTPLQSASICGMSPEVMKVLLENGANANELSHQYGNTPLQNIEFRLSDLENRVSNDIDIVNKIQKLVAMRTLLKTNIASNVPSLLLKQ